MFASMTYVVVDLATVPKMGENCEGTRVFSEP